MRPRSREQRTRNEVQVIRDKVTGEIREVCHGDAWQVRREEVWERDARRCVDCGMPVPLHDVKDRDGNVLAKAAEIHHKKRRGLGGSKRDDRKENLVTLCWADHNAAHHGPPRD